jgi:hypothetical protein
MTLAKTLVAAALVAACGSSSPAGKDAAIDGKPVDTASTPMLTVKNAPTATPWCSVSVNGGTASGVGVQTIPITAAGQISLVASAETGFVLANNMWHHTDGDTGGGEAGTVSGAKSSTTVTVTATASKCVWVCCPGSGNVPACPTVDQCP